MFSTQDLPHLDYYDLVQSLLHAPVYHMLFEALLILFIIRLFFTKSYRPEKQELTQKEKDQLIEEWEPEPLVPKIDPDNPVLKVMTENIVSPGTQGKHIKINGQECINLATLNFLCMTGNKEVEDVAIKAIQKYGVGSCGPRGFYGTLDAHLELEERLAKYLNVEEAILYPYGFATVASAIPAYSKRSDVIFCDEGACFSIQKGVQASRSQVRLFRHNDMEHLEQLLKEQAEDDRKNPKKAKVTRRFLIVEGLYINYGDVCPLPKLIELKYKYKVRLFIEESVSFGTLGDTGKGVTEYFGVDITDVDLICACLEYSIGSIGGFCAGRSFVVDHQRLSGQGYCFSASAPPLLAAAATKVIDIFEQKPDMFQKLQNNCKTMYNELSRLSGVKIVGEDVSPVLHIQLTESKGSREDDYAYLQNIVDVARSNGYALTVSRYLADEVKLPPPSIRIAVNTDLEVSDIKGIVEVIKNALL